MIRLKKKTYPYGMNDSTDLFLESRKCVYHLYRNSKLLMKNITGRQLRTERTVTRQQPAGYSSKKL